MLASIMEKFLYWTPRILSVLFIAFLSLFSLDFFTEDYLWYELIIAFFMHSIPSILIGITTFIAWKYEKIGGIIYIFLYITALLFFDNPEMTPMITVLFSPLIICGVLFLINATKIHRTTN